MMDSLGSSDSQQSAIVAFDDNRWKPMKSIHMRFPNLTGVMLEEKVFEEYQVGPPRDIPFFDDATKLPNFVDHDMNRRNQHQSVLQYAASCEAYGNCGECRGSPWAVLSHGDVGPYKMLTYRQLTKGVYLAASRSPQKIHWFNSR
jgi:hypothetical protein